MTSPRPIRSIAVGLIACLAMTACAKNADEQAAEDPRGGKPSAVTTKGGENGASAKASPSSSAAAARGRVEAKTGTGKPQRVPAKAPQSTPPAPGIYTFRQSGSMHAGGETYEVPERGTLEVEAYTKVQDGLRSKHIRDLGRGGPMESVYLFTKDEVLLQEITMQGFSCILRPSLIAVPIPLEIGETWSDTATCSSQGVSVTIDLEAEVLRKEQRKVGSVSVDTFVLSVHTETTGTGFEQTQESTAWLSPDHRLAVRTKTTSKTESVYGNGTSEYTEQLVSLTPR